MPIYFTPNHMNLPVFVHSIGNSWYQGVVKRETGFPYYHWLQTEHGEGIISIAGKSIYLKQGRGMLISPFVPHEYEPVENHWQTSFVSFYGTLQNQYELIVGQQAYILTENSINFSHQAWIDKMIPKFENDHYQPEEISVDCYRFLLSLSTSRDLKPIDSQGKYIKYVEPVLAEIGRSYSRNITVQELADKVFVSPQYLSRLFLKYMKTSAHDYLTNYRIKMAREMLINRPDLSVSDVGMLTGMNTVSHFIAVFKKKVGYTPLEFRNLHY